MNASSKRCKYYGQGMTEYIIVLALVVVAAIGVYSLFGKTVRNQISGVALEISGQSAEQSLQQAQAAANEAVQKADQNYDLANYDEAASAGGN